jgi:DNA-binding transcriptional LysR family regulator
MNIQQMNYFVAVADFGSFREAAKQLYVSQPTLSQSVKNLEDELAIVLFKRNKAGITLTPVGHDYYQQVVPFLREVNILENKMLLKKQSADKLSISSQHYDFLAPVVAKLQKSFQDLKEFRVEETTTYQVLEQVASGISELGVLVVTSANKHQLELACKEKHLAIQNIKEFKTHIITRCCHPLLQFEEVTDTNIRCYPQVRFLQEQGSSKYFSEDLIDVKEDDYVIHTTDRSTMVGILLETDAFCSGSGLLKQSTSQDLIATELKNSKPNHIVVLSRLDYPISDKAELFKASLEEILEEDF